MKAIFKLFGFTAMSLSMVLQIACGKSTLPDTVDESEQPLSKNDLPSIIQAALYPLQNCPERVWSHAETSLAEAQYLFLFADRDTAYSIYSPINNTNYLALPKGELAEEWLTIYNRGQFQGKSTLGFQFGLFSENYEDSEDGWWGTDIPFFFHEAFHQNWQHAFSYKSSSPSRRAQDYPIDWYPRYLRIATINALYDSFLNNQTLSYAAYWWDRYNTYALDEALSIDRTDRVEGTAEYAESILTAITNLGCDATEESLIKNIKNNKSFSPYDYSIDLDSESYKIGEVAGLLLRLHSIENWQSRIEEGETPAEVLLSNVSATEPLIDDHLEQSIQQSTAEDNSRLSALLDEDINNILDKNRIRMAFNVSDIQGSYSTQGFYRPVNHPQIHEITASMDALIQLNGPIKLIDSAVFELETTACSSSVHLLQYVSLDSNILELTEDRFSYYTPSIEFSDIAFEKIEQDGFIWLCPKPL